MKKLLLTVTLCLACAAAFAQGKVRLVNDSLHLVYFDPGANGGTNAGQAYLVGEGGQTLKIELWAGTSSLSLSLVATTDFAQQASPGTWAGMNVVLPTGFPGGTTPYFFAIDIYDGAAANYLVASTTPGHFYGTSGVFTADASSTIAPNSLVQHGGPANSTWTDGTYDLSGVSPGFKGAIMLTQVPEPTTLALAGLAGAALMIFRRRK